MCSFDFASSTDEKVEDHPNVVGNLDSKEEIKRNGSSHENVEPQEESKSKPSAVIEADHCDEETKHSDDGKPADGGVKPADAEATLGDGEIKPGRETTPGDTETKLGGETKPGGESKPVAGEDLSVGDVSPPKVQESTGDIIEDLQVKEGSKIIQEINFHPQADESVADNEKMENVECDKDDGSKSMEKDQAKNEDAIEKADNTGKVMKTDEIVVKVEEKKIVEIASTALISPKTRTIGSDIADEEVMSTKTVNEALQESVVSNIEKVEMKIEETTKKVDEIGAFVNKNVSFRVEKIESSIQETKKIESSIQETKKTESNIQETKKTESSMQETKNTAEKTESSIQETKKTAEKTESSIQETKKTTKTSIESVIQKMETHAAVETVEEMKEEIEFVSKSVEESGPCEVKNAVISIDNKLVDIMSSSEEIQNFVVCGTEEAKNLAVFSTDQTKKFVVSSVDETKDSFVPGSVETKDSFVPSSVETKDSVVSSSVETKDSVVSSSVETKDSVVSSSVETNKLVVSSTEAKTFVISSVDEMKEVVQAEIQVKKMKDKSKQTIELLNQAKLNAEQDIIQLKRAAVDKVCAIDNEIKQKKLQGALEMKKMEEILITNVMKMDLGLDCEKLKGENELESRKMFLDETEDIDLKIVNAFANNCEIISKESKDNLNLADKLSPESLEEKLEKDKLEKEKRDSQTHLILRDIENIIEGQVAAGIAPIESKESGADQCELMSDIAPVPFLFYVTPKQFCSNRTAASSSLEKNAHQQWELRQMKQKTALDSSTGEPKGEHAHAKEIEEQRKAGFFSLPRMVDPSEAYASEDARGPDPGARSHFSLPRFMSPKTLKTDNEPGTSSPSRSGLTRFKNFLLRRDSSKSESREENADDGSKASDVQYVTGTATLENKTLDSTISSEQPIRKVIASKKKRHVFSLGRLHHSEDICSSEGDLSDVPIKDSAVSQDTKVKSSSLTRPRGLWFGTSKDKDKDSPVVLETLPISVMLTKPSDDPICAGTESKQRKQRINLSLKGLGKNKAKDVKSDEPKEVEESLPAEPEAVEEDVKPEVEVLSRSPSYEMAIASHHDPDASPKKSIFGTGSSKLKQLFKNQSVALRNPFTRSSNYADKRKSCPAGSASDSPWAPLSGSGVDRSSAPDITDRHPSISIFIDDTPVAGSPPVPPTSANPTAQDKAVPAAGAKTSECVADVADFDEPPRYPPPSIPSSPSKDSLATEVSSSDGEVDFSEQPTSRPDWSASLEQNLRSTLERKLTFSLPPDAPNSGDGEPAVRSVERAIESRQQSADYIGSMVRCLHLSKCFIANSEAHQLIQIILLLWSLIVTFAVRSMLSFLFAVTPPGGYG